MKKISMTLLTLALAACAGKSDRLAAYEQNVTPEARFHLASLTVNDNSKCPGGEKHFSKAELAAIFKTDVKKHLCELKTCADKPAAGDISVKVVVGYNRVMNFEAIEGHCSGSYQGAQLAYEFTLSKNGAEFYKDEDRGLEARRSLFGNIKRIGVKLSGSGDKEDEKEDIDKMTKGIAQRIAAKPKK